MRTRLIFGLLFFSLPLLAEPPDPSVAVALSTGVVIDGEQAPPIRSKNILFPTSELFPSLLADPKQQQFFMSYVRMKGFREVSAEPFTAWLVGFGETLGLYRRAGQTEKEGFQLSLTAGLFGQFDWDSPSTDLINSDYTFGVVGSWRKKDTSARFRVYHQSSHLGDEFLLKNSVVRQNYTYEAAELLLAQELGPFRLYGGATRLFDREPSSVEQNRAQGGFEFTGRRLPSFFRFARPVAAVDVQSWEQQKWRPSYSTRAGFELGKAGIGGRKVRLMADYYKGFVPFGQFYDTYITYIGGGIYLGI